MGIVTHSNKIGCAYFNIATSEIFVMGDQQDTENQQAEIIELCIFLFRSLFFFSSS